jgi:hypothetical protein
MGAREAAQAAEVNANRCNRDVQPGCALAARHPLHDAIGEDVLEAGREAPGAFHERAQLADVGAQATNGGKVRPGLSRLSERCRLDRRFVAGLFVDLQQSLARLAEVHPLLLRPFGARSPVDQDVPGVFG